MKGIENQTRLKIFNLDEIKFDLWHTLYIHVHANCTVISLSTFLSSNSFTLTQPFIRSAGQKSLQHWRKMKYKTWPVVMSFHCFLMPFALKSFVKEPWLQRRQVPLRKYLQKTFLQLFQPTLMKRLKQIQKNLQVQNLTALYHKSSNRA